MALNRGMLLLRPNLPLKLGAPLIKRFLCVMSKPKEGDRVAVVRVDLGANVRGL